MNEAEKTRHNANMKRYYNKNERIEILVPQGTKERIKATGTQPATFIKELLFAELDKIEKYTK